MAIKKYVKELDKNKFAFGVLALSQFNIATGSSPDVQSVVAAFQGSTQLKASLEMVKAGYAQANDKQLTDSQASELIENMSSDDLESLTICFFSSLVGEDFNDWAAKIQAELDKQTEVEEITEAESDPNAEAPSSNGAKSNKRRSEP
ncbi:hypothetical protein FAES_3991 [Fibrella aestuarina BUZ 2]|uniref:Uncharacterized protein n=1 Tax=Fibrella aestuarina BUZ 2 TaxID=1166018 RepID=I0KCY9_9BACT|nr:hypothetical protein [Fibrella aestuarina]CCH01992.1 hypothetical protein FAES_3991 [Fibrella aestuarina BUZ 2]